MDGMFTSLDSFFLFPLDGARTLTPGGKFSPLGSTDGIVSEIPCFKDASGSPSVMNKIVPAISEFGTGYASGTSITG